MSRVGGQNSNSTRQLLKIRVWIYSVTHRPELIKEPGVCYSGKLGGSISGAFMILHQEGVDLEARMGAQSPLQDRALFPVLSLLPHTPSPPGQCISSATSAPSSIWALGAEHLLSLGLAGCGAAGS